ncbi:FRG1-like family protein [Ophiocordyceps camponoti-floridani]|uniref:FRG1-like family protein n=1 Tax=Ophiocordyceps camponoti-floridani TaxID=2030778 RepID=A0A8H4VH12_9HYPO|nr:FRG1-like family protein [Ophiocordyceps camponoti-floridani]
MVKPLTFKGDKKPKKRKRVDDKDTPRAAKHHHHNQSDEEAALDDDSWVSAEAVTDVIGPVIIVLPTDTPSALACDAGGAVFAMGLENVVDGNPATAEPHDVRQVWVANRVSGTESFRFKSHHGRYLSCDVTGRLSAMSEAVSPLESFNVIATADTPGTFQLQTLRDTLLTLRPAPKASVGAEVRGDADVIAFDTTFRIRLQARFKPRLRASKEERALAKISRKELEEAAGRRLSEDEVKLLKRARREGDYHEKLLDIKVKGKHDKFA